MSERKDFKGWQVDIVYRAQDGICLKCSGSLAKGFHRHHKDGDRSNNKTDNLELLCAECHRATFAEAYKTHRKQEARILKQLNRLITEGFTDKKLSGATMERMMDAMSKSLRISRSLNKMDQGIEYPSAAIAMSLRMEEQKRITDAYLEGFRSGSKAIRKILKEA